MIFRSDWFPRLAKKAFALLPPEPIWKWAESNVFLTKKHAAEPGYYRSNKTPWTRWLQELARDPWRMRNGRRVRVRKVRIRKCTQSGFTEGVLNIIRWNAKHIPKNCVYSINSKEEATNIRERLVDTLQALGEGVFKDGQTPEDLQAYTMRLREMTVWWLGSYSSGAFSNKFAPLVIADEVDDHAVLKGNATSVDLADERLKTADDEDLSIALSKPKNKDGPISKAHDEGDQFEWMVPCPICGCYQTLLWDRVKFSGCIDLTGHWDLERVLQESYYECVSGCHIKDNHKPWMEERGRWWQVGWGDPEVVSLSMTDIHSMHKGSTLGHLAKEFIAATRAAEKGDFTKLQLFKNGRLGEGFENRVEKIERADVLSCRRAYRRGIVPHKGLILVIGMDVGQFVNTKWIVIALVPNTVEGWVIDWGTAGQPADILDLMRTKTYLCPETGFKMAISLGFIDCRFLRDKVYAACLQMPRRLIPTLGLKAGVSTRSVSWVHVEGKPRDFGVITFIRADANSDLYLDRIKHKRPPGLHFPEDADDALIDQFCAERLLKDPVTGRTYWAEKPAGPNHWGDAASIALTGYDFQIDGPRTRAAGVPTAPTEGAMPEVNLALLTSPGPPEPTEVPLTSSEGQ